jgi:hypothetical protein
MNGNQSKPIRMILFPMVKTASCVTEKCDAKRNSCYKDVRNERSMEDTETLKHQQELFVQAGAL